MAPTFVQLALSAFLAAAFVKAESHTVSFINNCGKGTPQLIAEGVVVSNGTAYTKNGIINGIAYLQTGECDFNGEQCALMEFNLANPVVAGGGSSVDISLITPHKLNVPVGFDYYNGCDGTGSQCLTGNCHTAFFQPDDNQVQVACQTDNVDLMITFCPSGSSSSDDFFPSASAAATYATSTQKAATISAAAVTSTAAAETSSASSAVENVATSTVMHVAAATSVESTATASTSATSASSAPTTRASSKTCKAKASASKRSNQSAAKRANSWHHRSRNARVAF